MFGKALLPFLFALALFTSALPVPSSSDDEININQLENLAQEDFGSDFIDTPQEDAEKLIDDAENDYYYHKRNPQDNFPISFGDVITPSLGGTFDSFITTDAAPAPADEKNATHHNHEDFLPAGLRAPSLTGNDDTPLQIEDPAVAAEISSLAAAGALPTSI